MVTTTQQVDRRYLDRLHREAGSVLRRSARLQKHIAQAADLDEGTISRMVKGDVNASKRVTAFYELIEGLSGHPKTSAAMLIAGAILRSTLRVTVGLTVDQMQNRLFEAQDNEDRAQAQEDMAEHRVIRALAEFRATPGLEGFDELDAALDSHETTVLEELAWSLEVQILGRAMRTELVR